mgnify:CR=1 FL=1
MRKDILLKTAPLFFLSLFSNQAFAQNAENQKETIENKEFTLPDVSQTIICTRLEGRTPVPEAESLESLASHKCSMAIFLSVQMIDEVVKRLLKHYDKTTPIAIVQRATWEDQKVVMGTLETIAELVKKEKITKTAQILVGNFMGNEYSKSKLYDKAFSHEFRKGIEE